MTTSTAPARAFMVDRAGQAHSGLDTSLQTYGALQDRFQLTTSKASISALASEHTAHFVDTMQVVMRNAPPGSVPPDFDIRKAHNWAQVRLEAGLQAEDQYQARARGWRGLFPKIGRKLGEMNPAIDAMAQTLPTGEYTSVVCGAIILFFKAFGRMHEVRQRVLSTLKDYPQQLEAVETFLRLYPDDDKLYKDAMQLYISLLVAIEAMIVWFGHGLWDRVKVFMQQGLYAAKLEEKIQYLEHSSEKLRKQADLCDKEVTTEIVTIVRNNAAMLYELEQELRIQHNENIAAVGAVAGEVRAGNLLLQDGLSQVSGDLRLCAAGQDTGFNNVTKQLESTVAELKASVKSEIEASTNNFMAHISARHRDLLDWQRRTFELQQREEVLQRQIEAMSKEIMDARSLQQPLSQVDIIDALGDWFKIAQADTAEYLNLSRTIRVGPEISESILTTPSFQSWFASSSSRLLFVLPYRLISKINHTSFVTASLVGAIESLPPSTTLTHFCSRHSEPANGRTAANLMASLVSQLLVKYKFDLTRWTTVATRHDHLEYLYLKDVSYLCSLFKHLISALPYGAIFCLIDDMTVLEQTCDSESTRLVIQTLWQAVQGCKDKDGAILKVLVMTPDAKGAIVPYVEKDDLILLDVGSSGKDRSPRPKEQVQLLEYAKRKSSEDLK